MVRRIIFLWDLKQEELNEKEHKWKLDYLVNKVDTKYLKLHPSAMQKRQIEYLILYLKNLLVLVYNNNYDYLFDVLNYLAVTWTFSTNKGFQFVDLNTLLSLQNDSELYEKLVNTSLLIIPYIDYTQYQLKIFGGLLNSIISTRYSKRKPVLIGWFFKSYPKDGDEFFKKSTPIIDLIGIGNFKVLMKKGKCIKLTTKE